MTDEARQALSVLAMLPDGIAHEDLEKVMLSHSHRAAAALRQVGLRLRRSRPPAHAIANPGARGRIL